MSDRLSDNAGFLSDQASDTPSDKLSDALSDAFYFTTPDAPKVQFLDPVQMSVAQGIVGRLIPQTVVWTTSVYVK